jgi:hypothetical protein
MTIDEVFEEAGEEIGNFLNQYDLYERESLK